MTLTGAGSELVSTAIPSVELTVATSGADRLPFGVGRVCERPAPPIQGNH